MADVEAGEDQLSELFNSPSYIALINSISTAPDFPTYDSQYFQIENGPKEKMTISEETSTFRIDSIVLQDDHMEARKRIKFEKEVGKIIKQKIEEEKGAVSAGKRNSLLGPKYV